MPEALTTHRLPAGGLIDRARPLGFRFNGRPMQGYAGDSLASALLANGVRIVARSFKYRRPRGIFALGLEEPNAMLAVRDRHGYDPALRVGQVLLTEGLEAHTVTGWPGVGFDLGAVAGAFAGLLGAGFYYKTFMWPEWRWYEPLIRRATGFGEALPDTDRRARAHRHDCCDVLVIGAGPAGLAAATTLAGHGLRVIVTDDRPRAGGSLLWEQCRVDGSVGPQWAAQAVERLRGDDRVRLLCGTLVCGAYEGNHFVLLESVHDDGGLAGERLWKLHARHVVLASGAVDRPLLFPDNDRPGIMLAAAVRRLIGEFAVAPAAPLAVHTSNDTGYLTALAALAAGVPVTAVIDSRPAAPPAHVRNLQDQGVQCLTGARVTATRGRRGLRAVDVSVGGKSHRIDCRTLAVSGGWTPLIHLAAQRGHRPVHDADSDMLLCRGLPRDWWAAGAAAGAVALQDVLDSGAQAAVQVLAACGVHTPPPGPMPRAEAPVVGTPRAHHRDLDRDRGGRIWVDLQNDVKVSDLELAVRENYTSVEHVKRYTTLGMGTDQGRTSGANGLAVLAAVTGREPGSVGTTTFRPPYAAVRIGAVAHHRQGDLYRPRRRMPAHGAHAAAGAVFDDFGWERPDWYRSNGAVREAAVVREMAAVREAVGVFDGSPLGKIEVGGPDAATFLDRLYVTNVKSLEPGRIRYSLMLREDGVIFDDGVLACLGHNHYLAGPSSGNADAVAAWFERWHQSEWPELRVAIAPVTARWAVVALAGPQARVLLQRLEPDFDISAQALPHMHLREGTLTGYPVRVARVSFTGELQYEISVPARHGRALFENALARGSDLHARPVGLEAWLRLRLEKGYLHLGSDTNGRTTPDDVGMARTARSKRVDFVGRRSLDLPFNLDPNREQLVGLRALDGPLEVGGRILAGGCERPPCATEGYVTSACHSPAVGAWIGLALLQRGRERMDEDVRIWTSGRVLRASVCPPVFLDPENRRLRV